MDERFPLGHHNDHGDAWRHAYWSARMTQRFGGDWAGQFATAHEGNPDNEPTEESMDLFNNEVGRRIATDNPDATPEELGELIMRALDHGELVVIEDVAGERQLHYSDEISYEELHRQGGGGGRVMAPA